jgi:phosphatidylinositol-3-phosphatase
MVASAPSVMTTPAKAVAGAVAVAAALVLGASGCGAATPPVGPSSPASTSAAATSTPAAPTSKPARSSAPPPSSGAVTKVLVFVEENHSISEMKSQMPYTFGLAQQFGYATHYTAIGHPSLPNYIAIAGGQTHAITNDDPPSANPVSGSSVFGQAASAGKTVSVYADGMPANCATSDGGTDYAVKHNPWAYFVGERSACLTSDVPAEQLAAAVTNGTLPNVGMVIPNLCHDAHDCSLATADTWFKAWMNKIFQGPDWKSGHLAVVLTADEDDQSQANTVLTVVIHPSQKAHVVTTALTHYSLTRLYEEVAGLPFLYGAASATSMSTAFGLPLR